MPGALDPHLSLLWTAIRDGHIASAEMAEVPIGTEVRFRRDDAFLWSRIFSTPEEAIQEAERERRRLIEEHWTPVAVSTRGTHN